MTVTFDDVALYDPAAETVLVGAAMLSATAADYAAGLVTAGDFGDPKWATVWNIISGLRRSGVPAEPAAVNSELVAAGKNPQLLVDAVTRAGSTEREAVAHYAGIVRSYATRRRLVATCQQITQRARNLDTDAHTLAATAAAELATVRDAGTAVDEAPVESLAELLAGTDDPYDWVIPGLLERGDRLIITGGEGGGKSTLLRQLGLCAAGGLHPFDLDPIPPVTVALIDAENSRVQFRRNARDTVEAITGRGYDPTPRFFGRFPGRIDLTKDRDLASVHRLCDTVQPDILIIGPLYRLVPRALQTDDEAAPLLAALDTLKDRGITLVMEAHAGHALGAAGDRNLRPRGSAALLGWPEFGYGLGLDHESNQRILRPWRGDRDARNWPIYLEPAAGRMFAALETSDTPRPINL